MPLYRYKAIVQESSAIVEGEMSAASERVVSARLQQLGYLPVKITADQQIIRHSIGSRDISTQDVLFFTSKLAITLKAGLPLDECLKLLSQTSESKKLSGFLDKVLSCVQDGMALSDAIQQNSKSFARFYLNTLKAGELSGGLHEVLTDLTDYLAYQQRLKRSLLSALIYPIILLFVTLTTLIILLLFVVPQFQLVFEQMGQTLPLSTQLVINASQFLADYGLHIGIGGVLVAFVIKQALKDDKKRQPLDYLMLKLPLISEALIKLETGRFSRTMATLLGNGVAMLAALDVMIDSLNNTILRKAIQTVRDEVQKGQQLSVSMKRQQLFPPIAVQLIHVGEESGELTTMLRQVSEIYDAELKDSINRILVILEPLIIIGLGITVATIIISVLFAILSLNDFVI